VTQTVSVFSVAASKEIGTKLPEKTSLEEWVDFVFEWRKRGVEKLAKALLFLRAGWAFGQMLF
jgi:hypothetical protein